MIIWLILIDVALDNLWILLGENWCWSLLGLKRLNTKTWKENAESLSSLTILLHWLSSLMAICQLPSNVRQMNVSNSNPYEKITAIYKCANHINKYSTVISLWDEHSWGQHEVSVWECCPSYRQSNKGNKENHGPTLGVSFTEVSVS